MPHPGLYHIPISMASKHVVDMVGGRQNHLRALREDEGLEDVDRLGHVRHEQPLAVAVEEMKCSRREEGVGGTDVWRSRNIDGRYAPAENLGEPVGSESGDADPFVAPDESYLIICQEKAGGYGKFDLYIYFQRPDGSWTDPINMGEGVNSAEYEFRPYVTPDGKYLFFTSNRPNEGKTSNIFWVDAGVIEALNPLK